MSNSNKNKTNGGPTGGDYLEMDLAGEIDDHIDYDEQPRTSYEDPYKVNHEKRRSESFDQQNRKANF